MCGLENTNRPRGGALAALNPPHTFTNLQCNIRGDLSFHTPGSPGSPSATHARLTPNETGSTEGLSDLRIVIHKSGDLTRDAKDCGLFRQFAFPSHPMARDDDFVELLLDKPLSLEVGNDGIIGRRVSLYSRPRGREELVVAEGIVGFNFMNPVQSSV